MRKLPISIALTALGTFVAGAAIAYPLASGASSSSASSSAAAAPAATASASPADAGDVQLAHMLPFGEEGAFAAASEYIDDADARRAAAAEGEGVGAAPEPRVVPAPESSAVDSPARPRAPSRRRPVRRRSRVAGLPDRRVRDRSGHRDAGAPADVPAPRPARARRRVQLRVPRVRSRPAGAGLRADRPRNQPPRSPAKISWALHPADGTGIPDAAWVRQPTTTILSEEAGYNEWLADPTVLRRGSRARGSTTAW